MSESILKKLTALFGVGVVGVVVCLVMTIVTTVQEKQRKDMEPPVAIPTPAIPTS